MCDYSLEGFNSRKAEVGDKLVISFVHGFMREQDVLKYEENRRTHGPGALCLTCLSEEGTVLRIGYEDWTYRQLPPQAGYRDALYAVSDGSCRLIASLPRGTRAEVVSIPSQKTLDQKLGLDKLDTVTPESAPEEAPKEKSVLQRVVASVVDRF